MKGENMRDTTIDILLDIGIPAGVKGFGCICDAMELFEADAYYQEGKICLLYSEIAKKHNTTSSRVERAIRHAFETAVTKGNQEMVDKYLDKLNTQNSNLLRTLYLRKQQNEHRKSTEVSMCHSDYCALKQQIYLEAVDKLSEEMELMLSKVMQNIKENQAVN